MKFWLGVHNAAWLGRTDVPLFVSRSAVKEIKDGFTRARGPWALDSGGFTEIATHGKWTVSPSDYAREVRLWQREIGNLEWSAPQDWMCEPVQLLRSLEADGWVDLDLKGVPKKDKKGKEIPLVRRIAMRYGKNGEKWENAALLRQRVCVHQQRTIDNLLALRELAPEVPWIPVLQGWFPNDYIAHANAYMRAGINLSAEPVVGLGSVCRREKLDDAVTVIKALTAPPLELRLHGFGMKRTAFANADVVEGLASSDSLAWSDWARKEWHQRGLTMCDGLGKHPSGCQNCLEWGLKWRRVTIEKWHETHAEGIA